MGEGVRLLGCSCIRTGANGGKAALGARGANGMDSPPVRVISRPPGAIRRVSIRARTTISGECVQPGRVGGWARGLFCRAALLRLKNSCQAKEPLLGRQVVCAWVTSEGEIQDRLPQTTQQVDYTKPQPSLLPRRAPGQAGSLCTNPCCPRPLRPLATASDPLQARSPW